LNVAGLDCVLGAAGAIAASFFAGAGWLAVRAGCGSSATGFAGFTSFSDGDVELGRRELCRVCGCGGSAGCEVASVLSLGSVAEVGSGWSAFTECFGRSGFDALGGVCFGPGEVSEVDAPPEGDGSSAWAIAPPTPTTTHAESTKTATVNRNHQ
jgi:hypothetical protein